MQVGRIQQLTENVEKAKLKSKIQTNAWLYELILDLQNQVSELQSQVAELQTRDHDIDDYK
jgi:hypothetical protein